MPQPTSNKQPSPEPASGPNNGKKALEPWAQKQRDAILAGMNAYHSDPEKCDAIGRAAEDEAVRRLHGAKQP